MRVAGFALRVEGSKGSGIGYKPIFRHQIGTQCGCLGTGGGKTGSLVIQAYPDRCARKIAVACRIDEEAVGIRRSHPRIPGD